MNFVMGLPHHQISVAHGRALEHGILRSEVQFLMRTQNFSLSHAPDKMKNIFLYMFVIAQFIRIFFYFQVSIFIVTIDRFY